MTKELFGPLKVGSFMLRNRILRSATFEGMCDVQGNPTPRYLEFYRDLASRGPGAIVSGFVYVSSEGKAIQPGQGGMDTASKVAAYRPVTEAVREREMPFFLQIAHAGRQTRRDFTGLQVVGASTKRSIYFRDKPHQLSTAQASAMAQRFGMAAMWAREAGFSGVQLHAAHGYLIHQFLHPGINRRDDEYGPDPVTGIGTRFLEQSIQAARAHAGEDYPIWVKVSAGDDLLRPMTRAQFGKLIVFLDQMRVDCIEVSYGTMDFPLSIFRGDLPTKTVLAHNALFATRNPLGRAAFRAFVSPFMSSRHKPYSEGYNLSAAAEAARLTNIPVFAVGGWRSGAQMRKALAETEIAGISLCRPFLREPDFIARLEADEGAVSTCTHCNRCAVMCDSTHPTRCYETP